MVLAAHWSFGLSLLSKIRSVLLSQNKAQERDAQLNENDTFFISRKVGMGQIRTFPTVEADCLTDSRGGHVWGLGYFIWASGVTWFLQLRCGSLPKFLQRAGKMHLPLDPEEA